MKKHEYQSNGGKLLMEHEANILIITKIMKDLKTNKSRGSQEIQNEMLKYAKNDYLVKIITNLFTRMFENGLLRNKFNVGKIVPIIKDKKKSNKQMTNIRPIIGHSEQYI